jgi:hypothetical protein
LRSTLSHRVLVLCLAVVLLPSCVTVHQTTLDVVADGKPRTLRVTLADDERLKLHGSRMIGDTIYGQLSGRVIREMSLPVEEVREVEVYRTHWWRVAAIGVGVPVVTWTVLAFVWMSVYGL